MSRPTASKVKSTIFLGIALFLFALELYIFLNYHVSEGRGVTSVVINGHTFIGNPPAVTFSERDPVSFLIVVLTMSSAVLISLIDLIFRYFSNPTWSGKPSLIVGSIIILISLRGLIWGFLSLGVIGIFIVLSAFPLKS